MIFYRKFLLCVLLLLSVVSIGYSQSAQSIAAELAGSSVILEMRDSRGVASFGSGFFIGAGLVATNAHVVSGFHSGAVRVVRDPHAFDIEGLIARDRDRDLAVLKVSSVAIAALSLGDSDVVRVGDVVYTLGNPHGLEGVFSEGRISNIITGGIPGVLGQVLQFTAAISRGSSGGAVVNNVGEVIGIVSSTRDDGQNLNFAVPVNALKRLIESASGEVKPLSEPIELPASDKTPLSYLLSFVVLSAVAFGVIHLLPSVKVEKWWMTFCVGVGIGLCMLIVRAAVFDILTPQLKDLYTQPISEEGLIHMLGCLNCIPVLLMIYGKCVSYLVLMSVLIGSLNKIKGIEVIGYFNVIGIAVLIVVAEFSVNKILPFG